MASGQPKNSSATRFVDSSEFYARLPESLIPDIVVNSDSSIKNTKGIPFVDKFVETQIEEVPKHLKKSILAQNVSTKYLSLSASEVIKPKLVGPKRSKFRKQLSSRQRKANKIFDLDPELAVYSLYEPLHQLWSEYIADVIDKIYGLEASQRVSKADWHGAIIQVTQSLQPSLIGVQGILLKETTNALTIITPKNKYLTIPKPNNIFSIQINDKLLATIYGNHILYRTSDRSVRKYKSKKTLDIGVK